MTFVWFVASEGFNLVQALHRQNVEELRFLPPDSQEVNRQNTLQGHACVTPFLQLA